MLKSLLIKNFQSHKNTEIELSPFVTAIIGLNNHGKSAVLRAFQKVIRNEPDGTTFISDGEKQCEITLVTDSGKVCRSVKNDNSADANKYIVNDKDKFVKFDREGIPTEVLALLDTSPPQLFGDIDVDFNFQSQLDQLFLVQGDGLPSKRGKILGSVTGVDVVNRAIQLCATAMKSSKSEMNRTEQSIGDVNNKLTAYADLDEVGPLVQILSVQGFWCEEITKRIASYQNLLSSLENLIEQGNKATSIVETIYLEEIDSIVTEIVALQKRIQVCCQLLSLQERQQRLQRLVDIEVPVDTSSLQTLVKQINVMKSIQYLEKTLNKAGQVIIQTQGMEEIVGEKEEIQQTQETLQIYKNLRSTLFLLQIKIQSKEDIVTTSDKELKVAEEAKVAFERELGVCPTCGKAFSKRYWFFFPEASEYVLLTHEEFAQSSEAGLLCEICSEEEAPTEKEAQIKHMEMK